MALVRCAIAFFARQASRPRSIEYRHDSVVYTLDTKRCATTEVGTRFGKVRFTRPVGRRADGQRGPRDLPVDRALGLVGGFSLGTVAAVTKLCAQMAFALARATFASFCEWSPSQRAVLRMIDAVGAEARGFLEQAPPRRRTRSARAASARRDVRHPGQLCRTSAILDAVPDVPDAVPDVVVRRALPQL